MNIIIHVLPIVVGILIIYFNTRALIRRSITEGYAFWWGILGLGAIICGIFPEIIFFFSGLTGIRSSTLALSGIITMLLFMVFRLIRQVTVLNQKQSELAMQITLLNQENESAIKERIAAKNRVTEKEPKS